MQQKRKVVITERCFIEMKEEIKKGVNMKVVEKKVAPPY